MIRSARSHRPRLWARARASSRAFSALELAAAFALFGSLVAVAVPTFLRDFKASRFVEPTQGLAFLGSSAVAYAAAHATQASTPGQPPTLAFAFPRSVGLTPVAPPRGRLTSDPRGTWSDPTWQALHFPAAGDGFAFADGDPHAFAFAFDSGSTTLPGGGGVGGGGGLPRATFVAHAHGDLDGDGATSTFEVRGHYTLEGGPSVEPGLFVQDALE